MIQACSKVHSFTATRRFLSRLLRKRAERPAAVAAFVVFAMVLSARAGAASDASGRSGAATVTFSQLAACPLVAPETASLREKLSPAIREAEGKRVEVTGYMLPVTFEKDRAVRLLLTRNQKACCSGQLPAANEFLVVTVPSPGMPVAMDVPVRLRGTLRVAPVITGGEFVQFYALEDAELIGR